MVVEVPAALVIDTLAYPFDRNAVSRFKAGPGIFENTLFSETESAHAEPETLRRHYWPTACAPIIKQFLARQEMLTGQRAKIMLLIEAGAGLPFLADQALLDNEAAATLFSAAANMAEVRGKLLARIDNRAMIA